MRDEKLLTAEVFDIYTCLTIRPAKEGHLETSESSLLTCGEAVDELFVITFHSIRDTATDAISKICDLTGKVIKSICINKPVCEWQFP